MDYELNNHSSIFQQPLWVSIFALTAAIGWGWAYPLIKLGFTAFGITADMTGSKMLFAGIRFFLAGCVILLVAKQIGRDFHIRKPSDGWFILLYSLLNTTLHYAFFYFGLSHSQGARASILNSLSVFSVVILSCLFFRSDHLTSRRMAGCAIGFAGILMLGLDEGDSGRFTWLGDGMIVLNTLCAATASLLTRGLSHRMDVFVGTGYCLTLGGALLIVPGILLNGTLPAINLSGCIILFLLVLISTVGFGLYNKLLSCNPIGKVAIYNSLIPVCGAVTSCLCLHEPFYWKYLWAGALAAWGTYLINSKHKKEIQ